MEYEPLVRGDVQSVLAPKTQDPGLTQWEVFNSVFFFTVENFRDRGKLRKSGAVKGKKVIVTKNTLTLQVKLGK